MKSNQLLVIVGACIVSVALRTIESPIANFSSMVALALLCGAVIRHPAACLLPLSIRLLTDVLLHFKTGYGFFESWPFDYAAYIVIALIGSQVNPRRVAPVLAGTVASVGIYFLLSNLGVWFAWPGTYARTPGGLVECYVMAIPFVRGTIFGNLLMAPLFFAAWNMATSPEARTENVVAADESGRV